MWQSTYSSERAVVQRKRTRSTTNPEQRKGCSSAWALITSFHGMWCKSLKRLHWWGKSIEELCWGGRRCSCEAWYKVAQLLARKVCSCSACVSCSVLTIETPAAGTIIISRTASLESTIKKSAFTFGITSFYARYESLHVVSENTHLVCWLGNGPFPSW